MVNNWYRANRYSSRLDMLPRPTIEAFDRWLAARTLRLEEIVVGGSALALLGVKAIELGELELTTLGRADLLKTKLFALCDRGTDLGDCVALAPTPEELEEAGPWLAERDAHPGWRDHVRLTLEELRGRLGRGL